MEDQMNEFSPYPLPPQEGNMNGWLTDDANDSDLESTAMTNNLNNGNGNGNGGGNNSYTYKGFVTYRPRDFDRTGGAVALTRWIEKMESVIDNNGSLANQRVKYAVSLFIGKALTWWNTQVQARGQDAAYAMAWDDFKALLTTEFCPSNEIEKLEGEFYNHSMVGVDHAGYTDKFHELAKLVPHLVTPEAKRVTRYINGLPSQIHRMFRATQPATIQAAILTAGILTDEAAGEKRKERDEASKSESAGKDEKKAKGGQGFVAPVPRRRENGNFPKCARNRLVVKLKGCDRVSREDSQDTCRRRITATTTCRVSYRFDSWSDARSKVAISTSAFGDARTVGATSRVARQGIYSAKSLTTGSTNSMGNVSPFPSAFDRVDTVSMPNASWIIPTKSQKNRVGAVVSVVKSSQVVVVDKANGEHSFELQYQQLWNFSKHDLVIERFSMLKWEMVLTLMHFPSSSTTYNTHNNISTFHKHDYFNESYSNKKRKAGAWQTVVGFVVDIELTSTRRFNIEMRRVEEIDVMILNVHGIVHRLYYCFMKTPLNVGIEEPKTDNHVVEFLRVGYELKWFIDLCMEHFDYNVTDFINEEANGVLSSGSSDEYYSSDECEEFEEVDFQTKGEENVVIRNLSTQDLFLNKLCTNDRLFRGFVDRPILQTEGEALE
nr:reverse transcriptase domain-containing protein [Tanacetum cinerariifolium]